jgi:hypothetical protein
MKFLQWLLCKNNIHPNKIKFNMDDTWHECIICKKQKIFTEEEYSKINWNILNKNTIKWRFYYDSRNEFYL